MSCDFGYHSQSFSTPPPDYTHQPLKFSLQTIFFGYFPSLSLAFLLFIFLSSFFFSQLLSHTHAQTLVKPRTQRAERILEIIHCHLLVPASCSSFAALFSSNSNFSFSFCLLQFRLHDQCEGVGSTATVAELCRKRLVPRACACVSAIGGNGRFNG